jgi:hypothetical protein
MDRNCEQPAPGAGPDRDDRRDELDRRELRHRQRDREPSGSVDFLLLPLRDDDVVRLDDRTPGGRSRQLDRRRLGDYQRPDSRDDVSLPPLRD